MLAPARVHGRVPHHQRESAFSGCEALSAAPLFLTRRSASPLRPATIQWKRHTADSETSEHLEKTIANLRLSEVDALDYEGACASPSNSFSVCLLKRKLLRPSSRTTLIWSLTTSGLSCLCSCRNRRTISSTPCAFLPLASKQVAKSVHCGLSRLHAAFLGAYPPMLATRE
jgi:hypothetical protein